ncbi:MAG: hypothetical protein WA140_03055, partial [Geobacteraceae bacterium]
RYLRWLVFGSSTYVVVRLRRLNPRRLDFILDLKLVSEFRTPVDNLWITAKGEGGSEFSRYFLFETDVL